MIQMEGYIPVTVIAHEKKMIYVYLKSGEKDNRLYYFSVIDETMTLLSDEKTSILNDIFAKKKGCLCTTNNLLKNFVAVALSLGITITSVFPAVAKAANSSLQGSMSTKGNPVTELFEKEFQIKEIDEINHIRTFNDFQEYTKAALDLIDVGYKKWEMFENSLKWHNANESEKEVLKQKNIELGALIGATIGQDGVWRNFDGSAVFVRHDNLKVKEYLENNEFTAKYKNLIIINPSVLIPKEKEHLKIEEYFPNEENLRAIVFSEYQEYLHIDFDHTSKKELLDVILTLNGVEDKSFILENSKSAMDYLLLKYCDFNIYDAIKINEADLIKFINESIARFDYANIPEYIEKYDLYDLEDAILENKDNFLKLVDAVEKNTNLPQYVKEEFLRKIDYINDYKNVENIAGFIDYLPYLVYQLNCEMESGVAGTHSMTQGLFKISIISIGQGSDVASVGNHEAFHFIFSDLNLVPTEEEKQEILEKYQLWHIITGVQFSFIEEGLTEIFSSEYSKENTRTYKGSCYIARTFIEIFGAEAIVAAQHHSYSFLPIVEKLLEFYTVDEINAMFARFNMYKNYFDAAGIYTMNMSDLDASVLQYQVVEDLLDMYKKVNGKTKEFEDLFIMLVSPLVHEINFDKINNYIEDGVYKPIIPEYYELVSNNFFEKSLNQKMREDGYEQKIVGYQDYYSINTKERTDTIVIEIQVTNKGNPEDMGYQYYIFNPKLGTFELITTPVKDLGKITIISPSPGEKS